MNVSAFNIQAQKHCSLKNSLNVLKTKSNLIGNDF